MGHDFSKYNDSEALRIAGLIAGFIKRTLSEKEHTELDEWVAASDQNMQLFERLTDEKNMEEAMNWMQQVEVEKALARQKEKTTFNKLKRRAHLWQWAVAASLVITAGILMYVYRPSKPAQPTGVIAKTVDILPGSNQATLQLGDGKLVVLGNLQNDSSINGQIKISAKQGEVIYNDSSYEHEPEYHTLTVPRKGFYKLVLADGTKVWLNSESSIRYPSMFSGKERRVWVTGEVFFEVAKMETPAGSPGGSKRIPFIAVAGDM
ncbi:MAG TPA: FecR domain-containing protein, partial [Chitinophagaceae bacterium]